MPTLCGGRPCRSAAQRLAWRGLEHAFPWRRERECSLRYGGAVRAARLEGHLASQLTASVGWLLAWMAVA